MSYVDYTHKAIMVTGAYFDYDLTDETIWIKVMYAWLGSPHRDFTVKVYSANDEMIYDVDGQTNMLYTDGREPSEFVTNPGIL